MTPRSLTDDIVEAPTSDTPVYIPAAAAKRRRLTVREMTVALEAAHGLLDGPELTSEAPEAAHATTHVPPAEPVENLGPAAPEQDIAEDTAAAGEVGAGGADRSRAALCHDALEGLSPVTPPIVASAPGQNEDRPQLTSLGSGRGAERPEPWLPDHDGPVSLTGVAAPRTRTVRRSTATLEKGPRRPNKPRSSAASKPAAIDSALATVVAAAPPRILVVSACGGSGATTAAVLIGAALAPAVATVLVAGGADRGALAIRSDAHGGDVERVVAWAAAARAQRSPLPDGSASCDAGTGRLTVVAGGRDEYAGLDSTTACDVFNALAAHGLAGALDWTSAALPPKHAIAAATHVLVTAPATSPGLLDAEYAVEALQSALPASMPVSLLTVDVRGRNPRRAGRAALARLRALQLPITAMPYDPALADEPRVHWPALRPRTRSAVTSALSQLLHHPHREDPK